MATTNFKPTRAAGMIQKSNWPTPYLSETYSGILGSILSKIGAIDLYWTAIRAPIDQVYDYERGKSSGAPEREGEEKQNWQFFFTDQQISSEWFLVNLPFMQLNKFYVITREQTGMLICRQVGWAREGELEK